MKKSLLFVASYQPPFIESMDTLDEDGVLCQSPQGDLSDIGIGREEGEDDGWLN